jgi:hypothetical protein
MPRISLWRENRSNDYKFFNDRAREQFTIGGTGINVHKYLGSENGDGTSPIEPNYNTQSELNIQDLLFLENRDRIYDPDIYSLRGHYNVSDMDFDLSQFGLFLQNDTLFITFHLTDMIERLGRKLMPGDVLELPHLRDDWPLDETVPFALRKYYVIQDATRAAEGYSPTWWPHLWRVKATPLVNSQEFNNLIENLTDEETGNPLGDLLNTYNKEIAINNAVVQQALIDVPEAGYNTDDLYTLPTQIDDSVNVYDAPTADDTTLTTDNGKWTADVDVVTPTTSAYNGYLTGDGKVPNGFPVQTGIAFPSDPNEGDYVLRLDFYPNRLFRYNGNKWIKVEDDVRHSYIPEQSRTQLGTFINNDTEFSTKDGQTFTSKQGLSEVIKPKADN